VNAAYLVENAPLPLFRHIGGILATINHMAFKLFFPSNLAYDYDIPIPASFPGIGEWIIPLLLCFLIGYLAWNSRRQLFLVLLFLIPLFPYLNIVQIRAFFSERLATFDHYLLFTTVAMAPLVTNALLSLRREWRTYAVLVSCGIILFFAVYSHHLGGFWKTRETLLTRSIAVSPTLPRPYIFLGRVYLEQGKYEDAANVLEQSLALQMSLLNEVVNADIYQLLGDAYAFSGRYEEAERYYKLHLASVPDDIHSIQNLSQTLTAQRKGKEARTMVRRWLSLAPGDQNALTALSLLNGL
jgi:tetratricopeptide (TPR) repeat protein